MISKLKVITVAVAPCMILFTSCGNGTGNQSGDSTEVNTDAGYTSIFNGKDLSGWDGDTVHWSAENGILTGEITPEKPLLHNTYIIWQGGQPGDFELKLQFRITSGGNSGINYRSEKKEGSTYALKGYQADIDGANRYSGQNFDEEGRTTLAYRGQRVTVPESNVAIHEGIKHNAWAAVQVTETLGEAEALLSVIKNNEWNEYLLVAKGNRLQHYINGTLMSDVMDNDTVNRRLKGWLGLQIHSGPPMKVEFKDIQLKQ